MNNIPKGYKLVPVVATLEMKNAGWRECERQGIEPEDIEMQTIWTAMHLEAPTTPQPIYDEAKERELFEAIQDDAGGNIERDSMGDYENPYVQSCWDGWQACAQSRAKAGEDE